MLERINCDAFKESGIESIYLPRSLKEIEREAFYSCNMLKKVEIPNDSELSVICLDAFSYTSIESIFIPQNITDFFNWFTCCENLKKIEFSENSKLSRIRECSFFDIPIESI